MRLHILFTLLVLGSLPTACFGQQTLLDDDFENNKNGWRQRHDSNFRVAVENGVLHLEKFGKNFISRGCLWYNKTIPGLNTLNDFSITFYASFVSGGDIFDAMDIQWGESMRRENDRIVSGLYQLMFMHRGEVKLDHFNRSWTYFVRKNIKTLLGEGFNPKESNKYELIQKDSFLIFRINGKEVMNQHYSPVAGNSIGFQQCLKSAWEIDKIIVRQEAFVASEKPRTVFDTVRKQPIIQPEFVRPAGKGLNVYPNPFSNELTVAFNLEKEESVQLSLVDMVGYVLQHHNRTMKAGPQRIRMYADVVPGSYLVKLQIGDKVLSAMVIKQWAQLFT